MALLLAPGGSLNSALTALDKGADALYIGLKGHSRGGTKGELGEKDIILCFNKAKEKGKSLYLAFNLIPEAKTVKGILNKIEYYILQGLAGVILNEPSLIQEVARRFPSLNITASIGCAISNLQEAQFYEDLGAKTLVLGPQLGFKEIRQIKAQTRCRVEVFIYGFHEMFTLGKCWLGGYVKQVGAGLKPAPTKNNRENEASLKRLHRGSPKRSGVCGQVCGLVTDISYKNIVGAGLKPAPTLAPQAFYVLHSLRDLIETGVDVFKLGGRYFKPQDTVPLVTFYRQLIDSLLSRKADFSWVPWEEEAKKLFHPPTGELIYNN